ncbi:MAG: glycosyltransferase family 4 protein [Gammaproteobacteria bacterium]|nr:glycosyltransferase family 4 protein [Gammaproteobacteria bacterium]
MPKYGRLGASSRVRMLQYLPWLRQAEIEVTFQALLPSRELAQRYRLGRYSWRALLVAYGNRLRALLVRRQYDLLWIEKEALPWMPVWLERCLLQGVPYVLDYDDAVFHHYDAHSNPLVRVIYGRRIDTLMAGAELVVAGNNYLALRAKQSGAKKVEVVPTVVDVNKYRPKTDVLGEIARNLSSAIESPRIVWIGAPATVKYLDLLKVPLEKLATYRRFTFRIVGGRPVDMPGVNVEYVDWAEDTEAATVGECDIGVMPLLDSPWERGKCGYKLVQYMACGLPVVASNIGVNPEIVLDRQSGFLVNSESDWETYLDRLLCDKALRIKMGRTGLKRVERFYSVQTTGPQMADLLRAML